MTKKLKQQYSKEWRLKNKDKIHSYGKKWREKNKEKIQEYKKKWDKDNKNYKLKYSQRYLILNKDKIKNNRRNLNVRFNQAKLVAKNRSLNWDISYNEFIQIASKNCYYSNNHKLPETGSGLDRIDNNKGYTINNVIPCCTNCNLSRANRYTVQEWKIMVEALENYKRDKK